MVSYRVGIVYFPFFFGLAAGFFLAAALVAGFFFAASFFAAFAAFFFAGAFSAFFGAAFFRGGLLLRGLAPGRGLALRCLRARRRLRVGDRLERLPDRTAFDQHHIRPEDVIGRDVGVREHVHSRQVAAGEMQIRL